jgi:hypothetical protein
MIPARSSSIAQATRHTLYISILAALAACGDAHGPSAPPPILLEGPYIATTFTAATDDTTFDLLTEGIGLALTLRAGGTTTGSFRVPDMPLNLEGTWDTSAARLHLHAPAAPLFLNQMAFVIGPQDLRGEVTIQTFTFRLTLTKQGAL